MATTDSPVPEGTARTVDPEGHDGVCFTAGPRAAVIGAGTIHAYLASRRKSPLVVAGISLGAVSAAAMQRVFRCLSRAKGATAEEQRSARWAWFRQYIESLCSQPLHVVWQAIPDQSDFFADVIPIRDTAVPPALADEEREARRLMYLKIKLGRWLAQYPTSVRLIASTIVNYVRVVERYPLPARLLSAMRLLGNVAWLFFLTTRHVSLAPQMFPDHAFAREGASRRLQAVVWLNLFSVTALAALLLVGAGFVLILAPPTTAVDVWKGYWIPALLSAVAVAVIVLTRKLRERMLKWPVVRWFVLKPLEAGAYFYSITNVFCLTYLVAAIAPAVWRVSHHHAKWQIPPTAIWTFIFWMLTTWVFALVTLPLSEVRGWLAHRGLLHKWPRPLFGWWIFIGCWLNFIGVVATLGLAGVLTWVWRTESGLFEIIPHVLAQFIVLCTLPLVALLLPAVLMWVWSMWGRRLVSTPSRPLKAGAWALSWGLAVLTLYGNTCLFDWWRGWFLAGLADEAATWQDGLVWHAFVGSALLLMISWFAFLVVAAQPVWRRWAVDRLLERVGLKSSLLSDLHLKLALMRLFDPDAGKAAPGTTPVNQEVVEQGAGYPALVLVAASLQTLTAKGQPRPIDQLWARPGTPLLHALRCALASPPLFAPVRIKGERLASWVKPLVLQEPGNQKQFTHGLDLVDGSVIRQNPLPALYSFLRGERMADEMEENNEDTHPAIHVVYGVPTGERTPDGSTIGSTIVDVGLASLRLSQRRDTQLEVSQTNFISRLEKITPGQSAEKTKATHAIFADEIAPAHDLVFEDSAHESSELKPARSKVLAGMAAGCRRSLETLYTHELAKAAPRAGADGCVACPSFLMSLGRVTTADGDVPGLPEICGACTQRLQIPSKRAATSEISLGQYLCPPRQMYDAHEQLGGRPRIVFVASGGVFRGAFHIGLLAALRVTRMKPDLIVGASVGTLMGGALGAMFSGTRPDVLEQLVQLFLHVDDRVALTRTLKNAARELGLRGRSIALSPRQMRRIVLRGSRHDPGYAATGAPSALIDAMADLFLIPHRATADIAAEFVAGHVTKATSAFLTQLRTETIRRLDIEDAVIGASLLEQVATDLLTDGTAGSRLSRQPFQHKRMAFYGTATNLCTHAPLLLGGADHHPGAPFDFVEAALASSAFPAVFAPRPESRVFPGTGRPDVLLADGGMFDNLPFQPALEILALAQRGWRLTSGASVTTREWLQQRIEQPDLLIAGALDPRPETDVSARGRYDSLDAVRRRAAALHHNVKIRSFETASMRVYSQLMRLESSGDPSLDGTGPHFVDHVVNGSVLSVFPTSREHLNGTFSFCASTGLKPKQVSKSIADGCYQTLGALADRQRDGDLAGEAKLRMNPDLLTARAVRNLTTSQRIDAITRRSRADACGRACHFFDKNGDRFDCPFAATTHADPAVRHSMREIYKECTRDAEHRPASTGH